MRARFENAWQSAGPSLLVWSALAFTLWLALTWALSRARARGLGLVAAAASWVLARLLMPYARIVLHWMLTVRW